jgi:hypothetical protein
MFVLSLFSWSIFPLKRVSDIELTGFVQNHEGLSQLQHLNSRLGQDLSPPQVRRIFPNTFVVCFTVVALSLSPCLHARVVSHVLAVGAATDRNELRRRASTEDTLAKTGDAATAASVQTCAVGCMCTPSDPYIRVSNRRTDVERTGHACTSLRVLRENNQRRKLVYHKLDLKFQRRLLEANFHRNTWRQNLEISLQCVVIKSENNKQRYFYSRLS